MSICSLEIPPSILQRNTSPVSVLFTVSWLMLTSPTTHRKAGGSSLPRMAFCWVWKDEQMKKCKRKVFSRTEKYHATKPWCRTETISIFSSALVQGLKSDAVKGVTPNVHEGGEIDIQGGRSLSTIYRAPGNEPSPIVFPVFRAVLRLEASSSIWILHFFKSDISGAFCVFLFLCLGNRAERMILLSMFL